VFNEFVEVADCELMWSVKCVGEENTEHADGERPRGEGGVVSQWSRHPAEAYVATVNVASELTSGRNRHCSEIRLCFRVSKASKHVGVIIFLLCG
jgi:adenosine deaminase